MKVLLMGTLNAKILAEQLRCYKVNAQATRPPRFPFENAFSYKAFDIIYGVQLLYLTYAVFPIKFFKKKCVVHAVGSDAFDYANRSGPRKKLWNLALGMCDEILFVTQELRQMTGLKRGRIVPIPIDTRMFKEMDVAGEKRDILYYCPNLELYRLDWVMEYAVQHPDETVTVLGLSHSVDLPNVKVIPHMQYHRMPLLYNMHRRLIRMTTHDGFPKMPYEAFLCGLEVIWNGRRITKVPEEMLMENTIPKLISILESIK